MDQNTLKAQLQLTVSHLGPERKSAEANLKIAEKQHGFTMTLLNIIEQSNAEPVLQQIACIYFKNVIRKYWNEENAQELPVSDREKIKSNILTLICHVGPRMRPILSEAVRIIGVSDFPDNWKGLLPDLVTKLGSTQDFSIILGLLETANTLLKVFRDTYSTDAILTKLKYCLTHLQQPITQYFQRCMEMVKSGTSNDLAQVLSAVRLITRIFYSLNFLDLPEYFEDNMKIWMGEFLYLIQYENKSLASQDDDLPGIVEKVQTAVLENIKLYASRYDEEFAEFVPQFAEGTWNLLMKTDQRIGNDGLVVQAIKVMTQFVGTTSLKSLFQNLLKDIILKVAIPNLTIRETDFENFEDNPMDYIRADIEGSDLDTRKRCARDLIRSMLSKFPVETVKICKELNDGLVNEFVSNPGQNWARFDCAVSMMIAVSAELYTIRDGVTKVTDGIELQDFFSRFVLPVVTDANNSSHPVVKADVIKFFTTFRNQMPKDIVVQVLPHLVRLLKDNSFVVHTYAASCIERIFMIKETNINNNGPKETIFRYGVQELNPILESSVLGLFGILSNTEHGATNEYVVKAVMRILSKSEPQKLAGAAQVILTELSKVLQKVCEKPQNPAFIHYLFESLAILINYTCKTNPSAAETFEQQLTPSFQFVLEKEELAQLTPYVFQIMAQLIQLNPNGVSAGYLTLFQPLLKPATWENQGIIPALVCLIEAFLRKAPMETVGNDTSKLEGILGIFQLLLSKKSTCEMSFRLLVVVIEFVKVETYGKYLDQILNLTLQRLQSYQDKRLAVAIVHFLSVLIGKHGAQPVVAAFNKIQPNAQPAFLFSQIVNDVWTPSSKNITKQNDRKACVIALSRILSEVNEIQQQPYVLAWANSLLAILHILEMPPVKILSTQEELADLEESGYKSSFVKLVYAQTTVADSFKEIQDPKQYFIHALSDASTKHAAVKSLIQETLKDKPSCQKAIQMYCQQYGKSI